MKLVRYIVLSTLLCGMISCSDSTANGPDTDLTDAPVTGDTDATITDESGDNELTDGDELLSDDELLIPDEGYPSPEPDTCAFIGANCGDIDLGDKTISCGACADPDTCGGGGTPYVCGHPLCEEGWCWENPYPQGDDLNDIYALDATHVWAVGDSVAIFYNGVSWERIPYQLRQGGNIQAVYAADADNVWAVATDGCILFLNAEGLLTCDREIDDDGFPTHWTETDNALYDIHGTGPNDIWAVGREIILHWDGETWTTAHTTVSKLNAVWAVDADTVYAGGESFLRYDGTAWKQVETNMTIYDLWAETPDMIWAVGSTSALSDGVIGYFSNDAWYQELSRDSLSAVTAVGGLAPGQTVMADASGYLFRKRACGAMPAFACESWLPYGAIGGISAISAADGLLWFVGSHGLIGNWDTKFVATNRTRFPGAVTALFANSPFDLWAAGDQFFAHWNGTTWRFMATEENIVDLYGSTYNDIYAETKEGFLHYDGTRWDQTANPGFEVIKPLKTARDEFFSRPDENSVRWCFAANDCWEINGSRFIRETPDGRIDTTEWPFAGLSGIETFSGTSLWRSCVTDDGRVYAANGQSLIVRRKGLWREVILPEYRSIGAVACHGEDAYFVTFNGETLYHDNGTTITDTPLTGLTIGAQHLSISTEGTIYVGSYDPAAGLSFFRIEQGAAVAVETPVSALLRDVLPLSDTDLWAAGDNAFYRSDGADWTLTLPADLTDRGLPRGETEVILHRIFAQDGDNVWMLGRSPDDTTAYIFSWDGTTWVNDARSSLYDTISFTDVWALDQQNVYITLGTLGWIYHYKNIGAAGMIDYVAAPLGTPLQSITGRPDDAMWVFGEGGVIMRYDLTNDKGRKR
ncbi:MAG TPA: hypothetical protein PLV42_06805 [bacterium]|nr:hypothetical protein [bacterium]